MDKPAQDLIQFLARFSVYTVLPGFWFAYIADINIWIGGVLGFIACLLLAIPILISGRRRPARQGQQLIRKLEGDS